MFRELRFINQNNICVILEQGNKFIDGINSDWLIIYFWLLQFLPGGSYIIRYYLNMQFVLYREGSNLFSGVMRLLSVLFACRRNMAIPWAILIQLLSVAASRIIFFPNYLPQFWMQGIWNVLRNVSRWINKRGMMPRIIL